MLPVVAPAAPQPRATARKELVGVDIFVNFREPQANALADTLRLLAGRIEIIKMENLYLFDGAPGFSLGQGQ